MPPPHIPYVRMLTFSTRSSGFSFYRWLVQNAPEKAQSQGLREAPVRRGRLPG